MRVLLILLSVHLLLYCSSSILGATPSEVLQAAGLTKLDKTWIILNELRLADRLDALEKIDRRLQESRKHCEAQIQALVQSQAQLATAVANQQRLQGILKTAPASPLRTMLERDQQETQGLIARMKPVVPDVATWGSHSPLKAALAEQSAWRIELMQGWLEANRWSEQLPSEYEALSTQESIKLALSQLEVGQKLGPRSMNVDRKRLANLQKSWATGSVPFYREGTRIRVSLLVNEEWPVTMTWQTEQEATLLPYSLVQSLGINPNELGPSQVITANKTAVQVQSLQLSSVRIGGSIRRNLTALVLGSEQEHWGAMLGTRWQSELGLQLEPESLLIRCSNPAKPAK